MRKTFLTTAVPLTLMTAMGNAMATPWIDGTNLWLDVSDFKYEEPGLMRQEGNLYGLGISRTHSPTEAVHLRVAADYLLGSTDYTGATQEGTPATSKADDRIWSLEGIAGFSYPVPVGRVTVETGFGIRDWSQDLKDGETESGGAVIGYRRGHRYHYIPLGLGWEGRAQSNRWGWDAGGHYQHVLSGYAWARMGGAEGRFLMDDGYGFRLHAALSLFDSFVPRLRSEVYVQRWSLSDSELGFIDGFGIGLEPANKTTEIGVRLGIGF